MGFVFCCQNLRADVQEHKLPVMAGTVIYAEGSFFGYGLLRPGDLMKLDLEALAGITNVITFERKKASAGLPYIPLPAPLRIDKIERDQDGQLQLARLVAGSKASDGTERLIIDIQRTGTEGTMWIIEEHGIVYSVARLKCRFTMR